MECKPKVYSLMLKIKIGDGNFEMGLGWTHNMEYEVISTSTNQIKGS
jgi:hypothetical protein